MSNMIFNSRKETKQFESYSMKFLLKLTGWLFVTFLILITIYKLNVDEPTPQVKPQEAATEVKVLEDQLLPKDPFKEALEKQSLQTDKKNETRFIESVQSTQPRDPFKEFLDKQNKDLTQSKVSPFESPK